jgi:hypothetical protein
MYQDFTRKMAEHHASKAQHSLHDCSTARLPSASLQRCAFCLVFLQWRIDESVFQSKTADPTYIHNLTLFYLR